MLARTGRIVAASAAHPASDDATTYRREQVLVRPDEAKELARAIGRLLEPWAADARTSPPELAGLMTVAVAFIPESEGLD